MNTFNKVITSMPQIWILKVEEIGFKFCEFVIQKFNSYSKHYFCCTIEIIQEIKQLVIFHASKPVSNTRYNICPLPKHLKGSKAEISLSSARCSPNTNLINFFHKFVFIYNCVCLYVFGSEGVGLGHTQQCIGATEVLGDHIWCQ